VLKEFGKDLKRLRESKGISVAEISSETRINSKFINLLESGKFDFQPDTYIRSFLREYALAIDEDAKRILSDYDKAKAGFYAPRKFDKSDSSKPEIVVSLKATPTNIKPVEKQPEPVYQKSLQQTKPDYAQSKTPEPEYSNKSWIQKILLGLLIIAIAAGIYFLIDYLNSSGDNKTTVKPKTFREMSNDYEEKISGKNDSNGNKDSLKMAADSLRLTVKALKDIRIIVAVDDNPNKIVEEVEAKDSIKITAAKQFRFSTSSGLSTEIYLNGKYLRKPVTTKSSSIKDMLITKEGISFKEQ
jgi:cytoskeletal protein RodZ